MYNYLVKHSNHLKEEYKMSENKVAEQKKEEEEMYEFEIFFNEVITKGIVTKEREITKGFRVKLRPLDAGEQVTSQMVMARDNPYIPSDTVDKVRMVSMLSRAIISINDVPIQKEDNDKNQNLDRINKLYKRLMNLPASIVDGTYKLYLDCAEEQRLLYDPGEGTDLGEKAENF